MRIVAIIASPRGMQGNTGRLLEEVLSGVKEFGAESEVISLASMEVKPCVGCDICHNTGICSIKDDYEGIKMQLLDCDGFILASPNYIFSVTAQMKALFDRCNGLIHCMALEGKYAAVVETSGGGEDEEVLTYMSRFVNTLGAISVGAIGSPVTGIRTFADEENLYEKARGLGRELCQCIEEHQQFPEQEEFHAKFRARMLGLVHVMQKYWRFEHEYWNQNKPPRQRKRIASRLI